MDEKEISFRYHPLLRELDILQQEEKACQCCGKTVQEYYTSMYCQADVHCLCLACIASGTAAHTYDGDFIQDAQGPVSDPEKTKELFQRTPGYSSWQGEYWLTCCDDYCAYLGTVGTKELEELGIADEVFTEYEEQGGYANARSYLTKDGSLCGYLFQCLHCQQYHLWVDAD